MLPGSSSASCCSKEAVVSDPKGQCCLNRALPLQGRQIFLNLGHTLKYDERWAGEMGRLSPHCFCPERWLSDEGQKTGAFLPFGAGLRMCVGYLLAQAEMKVMYRLPLWHPLYPARKF